MIKSAIILLAVGRNGLHVGRRNPGFKGMSKAKMLKVDSSEEFLQEFSGIANTDASRSEQVKCSFNDVDRKISET